MRLLCKELKFKRKLNIAPEKKGELTWSPTPSSVHWLLQRTGGESIILLMQTGVVTHENDFTWIIENNNRAGCEGELKLVWGGSHSDRKNVLRWDGGSGTIWPKVNNSKVFLYVGRRGGEKTPDSSQQVNLG